MQVVYIIDSFKPYGAEKSIVQLALAYKSTSVGFICLYGRNSEFESELQSKDIKVFQLNLNTKEKRIDKAVNKAIPIIVSEQPKIIHSMLFQSDMVARKIKRKFPEIILVGSLVNNSYSKRRYSNLSRISKLKLFSTQIRDRISAKNVDWFISNSRAIVKPNVKALGISEEKIQVIHRGRKLENKLEKPLGKEIESLITDKIVFLMVGRLNSQKGQLDLIATFNELYKKRKDIILLIAGEGNLYDEMTNRIKKYNLKNCIHLLGYRDDITMILQYSDFFIYPTYAEGLSGALIEAVLSKTPCIVSNIDENKECFPDKGAIFFPVGNINEMLISVEKALSLDEGKWEKMILSSYEYARKNFSLSENADKYEKFYAKVLSREYSD